MERLEKGRNVERIETHVQSADADGMTENRVATGAEAGFVPERALLDGTLVMRLAYDGAGFSGFAEQREPELRTVAGEIRRALETLLRRPVELTCAGRTDAGVHAVGQYVSVPVTAEELELSAGRLQRALGALLPDDVALNGLYAAEKGFSARFDARARKYRYRIAQGPYRPLMTRSYAWWQRDELDVEAMSRAAAHLLGEQDFKSFCKASSAVGKPTCRNVLEVGFSREEALGEACLAFDIVGSSFLHSMVRTIVGSLVEVGRGHRDPDWIREVLAACDRRAAGPCAPARGLTFVDVVYDEGALAPWKD